MATTSIHSNDIATGVPVNSAYPNFVGNFYVRFSLDLGPNITATCIAYKAKGCIGIVPSVKETVATIVNKNTKLFLHVAGRDLSTSPTNEGDLLSTLTTGSSAVIEMNIRGGTYLTFLLLIDVLTVTVGNSSFDAALEEVVRSVTLAVDTSLLDASLINAFTIAMKKYDDANGSPDYHERFWMAHAYVARQPDRFGTVESDKEKPSNHENASKEVWAVNEDSLRVFGILMLVVTISVGGFLTFKGNCIIITDNEMDFTSRATRNSVLVEISSSGNCNNNDSGCLSLTEEGLEEILNLSRSRIEL